MHIIFVTMKIGTYIFTLLFTFILLLNSVKVTLTYTYYILDPVGFVDALCENKEKPELACNGKCQLSKMSKSIDQEQQMPESIIDFKELTLYHNLISEFDVTHFMFTNKTQPNYYKNLYSFTNSCNCFHPPRV